MRDHAPYKYPPRNTMPNSFGKNPNPLRISWIDTSFSPTVSFSVGTGEKGLKQGHIDLSDTCFICVTVWVGAILGSREFSGIVTS